MGTVGLSFGSATSGDGFDVATTVTNILAIQQGIETPWKNQLKALQSQDTAFSSMGKDLATLSTSLQALTSFDGVMYEKEGSSSNTDVLALTSAGISATSGSHEITVSQLAQTSSVYTDAISSGDTLSGSLTIQVGSGAPQTITLGDSSKSLTGLASAINLAGIGVKASVISDAKGSRLSIVSGTSGAEGTVTVSGNLTDETTGAAVGTQVGQTGQNARLTVDGIDIESTSNVVTTAIPGVSFQLLAKSSSPVQVQIVNASSDISTAVNSFVTAYNAVVSDIATQQGKDSTGAAEPLSGNPTLALIQSSLSQALLGGAASGSISGLSQLGINIGQDGKLSYSSSTLLSTLDSNFDDVLGYFQNAGSFGSSLTSTLNGLSSTSTKGAIYLSLQQNSSQETTLNKNISDEEARLALQKASLTTELNSANEILQSIPSQLAEVDKMYSAVTGYKSS
jgi:flagellar hook-associated protein 2